MSTGVRVTGLPEIEKNLKRFKKRSKAGLLAGLIRAGLFLQRKSQKIVPVEFDFLRQTAQTRKSIIRGKPDVTVSYGTDYAVYVHEIEENIHEPGKQAKFLEEPARTERPTMLKIIFQSMGKAFR